MRGSKSLAVAKYILERQQAKSDTVSPMQLIKLVYIAHGFMLGQHGRALLDEPVEAWQYGPVVPTVYHAVKHFRSNPVLDIDADTSVLAVVERDVLDRVADDYAKYDGVKLSSATHKPGTPWHVTWSSHGKSSAISNDVIENFYSELIKKPVHSAL